MAQQMYNKADWSKPCWKSSISQLTVISLHSKKPHLFTNDFLTVPMETDDIRERLNGLLEKTEVMLANTWLPKVWLLCAHSCKQRFQALWSFYLSIARLLHPNEATVSPLLKDLFSLCQNVSEYLGRHASCLMVIYLLETCINAAHCWSYIYIFVNTNEDQGLFLSVISD